MVRQQLRKEPDPPVRNTVSQLSANAAGELVAFFGSPRSVCDTVLQLLDRNVKTELEYLGIITTTKMGVREFTTLGFNVINYIGCSQKS